jgi:putative ABC transport system permease protein
MQDVVAHSVTERRFQASMLTGFGIAALVLGALGIYGVVAYSVAGRRREIGIRLVFGASPISVRRLVIREGLTPVWIGLVIGLAIAQGLGQIIGSMLFSVAGHEPAIACSVVALLVAVSIMACAIPAYRASRADPAETVRAD